MPTTWNILVGNSTLPDNGINTSWLHLNNQQGGGGGANVYLLGPASTSVDDATYSTSVEFSESDASVELTTSVANVTSDVLEANIIEDCQG